MCLPTKAPGSKGKLQVLCAERRAWKHLTTPSWSYKAGRCWGQENSCRDKERDEHSWLPPCGAPPRGQEVSTALILHLPDPDHWLIIPNHNWLNRLQMQQEEKVGKELLKLILTQYFQREKWRDVKPFLSPPPARSLSLLSSAAPSPHLCLRHTDYILLS